MRVAINGFGRIGRLVFRQLLDKDVELVLVNIPRHIESQVHLLKYDSVHKHASVDAKYENGDIIVNGKSVKVISERNPEKLPLKEMNIDLIIECTGNFRDREGAKKLLEAGAKKVLVSAPGKDMDATLLYGVNHENYDEKKHDIISAASCTTTCLAPIAKLLNEKFNIKDGLMTTIHSYTGDQRILDGSHKDLRRARAAALSMIPTKTGAAKAIGEVLPELKGKLDGLAVRVPTPDVSIVDLTVNVEKETSVEEVNLAFKEASEREKGIIGYTEEPLVSIDFIGNEDSGVVDALSTKVMDGKMIKILAWYDNEWGYVNKLCMLAEYISKQGV